MKKRRKTKTQEGHSKVQVRFLDMENPNWEPGKDGVNGIPRKTRLAVNMRESPAMWLFSHKHIGEADLRAANRVRMLYEASGWVGVQSIDYTITKVDGGNRSDGLTDRRQAAAKELNQLQAMIGKADYELLQKVCGECVFPKDLADTEWKRKVLSRRLRAILAQVSEIWGYRTRNAKKRVS